ncbi:50S ribosomal protein L11 [Candidatus Bathyarchaeota archaeon]|nr:50S ribosomal protein L11 [Candidatus Bathyarchaeota archaeon]
MPEKKVVEALINGGEATAGPPLGPALGPLGVNVMAIVNKINDLTKDYAGMKVPIKIYVDVETKEFEVEIGVPTTSALIIKELKAEKGSGKPNTEKIGNLTLEQIIKIAKVKAGKSYAKSLKGVVKEVLGTCISMGVTVNGKSVNELIKEINEGKYKELISD